MQVTPYASDELVLIVPRHHELAKRSSIAVGELQSLPLVSLNQVRPLLSRLLHLSRLCREQGCPALVSVMHQASLQKGACPSVQALLALVH